MPKMFESPKTVCFGSVRISNIRLWPKKSEFFDQYFICLVTQGTKVYTSEVSQFKSNGAIYFKENFCISGLQPDFEINIKIYGISNKVKISN